MVALSYLALISSAKAYYKASQAEANNWAQQVNEDKNIINERITPISHVNKKIIYHLYNKNQYFSC